MLALFGQDSLSWILHLITAVLTHFVDTARDDVTTVLNSYLLSTTDVSSPQHGAFTGRPALRRMNYGMAVAMDVLLTAVVVASSVRSLFDRGLRSHYDLKVMLPKLLGAVVFIHFSMPFMQMVIDLNNALGKVALSLGEEFHVDAMPWAASLSAPAIAQVSASQNLFHALFAVALVITLVILMLAYVIRYALLGILVVTAPIAALCTVLPETRGYARTWTRLFLVTVFMQAVQLMVLRVAAVTALGSDAGVVQTIYALATLFIMLKVPGALNEASHLETKAHTMGHNLEKSLRKALLPHTAVRRHVA